MIGSRSNHIPGGSGREVLNHEGHEDREGEPSYPSWPPCSSWFQSHAVSQPQRTRRARRQVPSLSFVFFVLFVVPVARGFLTTEDTKIAKADPLPILRVLRVLRGSSRTRFLNHRGHEDREGKTCYPSCSSWFQSHVIQRPSSCQDPKAEDPFHRVEVAIAVQEFQAVLNTDRRDEHIDGFPHRDARGAQTPKVSRGGHGRAKCVARKKRHGIENPTQPFEFPVSRDPLEDLGHDQAAGRHQLRSEQEVESIRLPAGVASEVFHPDG